MSYYTPLKNVLFYSKNVLTFSPLFLGKANYSQGEKRYISEEEFKQAKKILNERLKGIEEEKKKVTDRKAVETGINRIISSLKSFYSSIRSNLEQLDWGTKRGIVKALIERIRIDHDQVEIGFQIEEPAEDGKIFNLHHCTNYHDSGVEEGCQGVFSFLAYTVPKPWVKKLR